MSNGILTVDGASIIAYETELIAFAGLFSVSLCVLENA
jgi:hypothetical protein